MKSQEEKDQINYIQNSGRLKTRESHETDTDYRS